MKYLAHTYTKSVFTLYLKFKLNCAFYNLICYIWQPHCEENIF